MYEPDGGRRRNFTVSGAAPEDADAENTGDVLDCMVSAIFRWEVGSMVVRDWRSTVVVALAVVETARMNAIRVLTAILDDVIMRA